MKHAYLIMAHNEIPLPRKLIEILDYPDNDIYLHIDKKCTEEICDIDNGLLYSKIYKIPRIDVKWGGGRGRKM